VDAGGSYVLVQRWEHNLKQLNRMSVGDQEMMIGRTKEANEEIDGDDRPVTSHLTRVDLKEDGKSLKIVRQSLPYGTASGTHGLYFCAYCARLYNIEQQLLSMFGDADGKRDAMLRFTKPVTGGYYFAFCRTFAVAVIFCPLPVGEGWGRAIYRIAYSLFNFQSTKRYIKPLLVSYRYK
jgi:putative iron-dependent peroxidase